MVMPTDKQRNPVYGGEILGLDPFYQFINPTLRVLLLSSEASNFMKIAICYFQRG